MQLMNGTLKNYSLLLLLSCSLSKFRLFIINIQFYGTGSEVYLNRSAKNWLNLLLLSVFLPWSWGFIKISFEQSFGKEKTGKKTLKAIMWSLEISRSNKEPESREIKRSFAVEALNVCWKVSNTKRDSKLTFSLAFHRKERYQISSISPFIYIRIQHCVRFRLGFVLNVIIRLSSLGATELQWSFLRTQMSVAEKLKC